MKTPNIFDYATSELSQDAFLCWLLSWADEQYAATDAVLHKTADEFVRSVMKECGESASEEPFTVAPPIRQYSNIDILARISQGQKQYVLLIEDKKDALIGGDQLDRYKKTIQQDEDFSDATLLLVYLKTGVVSQAATAEIAGYAVYSGDELEEVFAESESKFGKVGNAIFADFYKNLQESNKHYFAIRGKPVDEWTDSWDAWQGFFNALQKEATEEKIEWGYAANQSGGEWVAWWDFGDSVSTSVGRKRLSDGNGDVYLEIHKKTKNAGGRHFLAFKVYGVPEEKQSSLRNELHERFMKSAEKHGWGAVVQKPGRFGKGNSMVCCETGDQDCWLAKDADGMLDMDKTIQNLRKAAEILSDAVHDITV